MITQTSKAFTKQFTKNITLPELIKGFNKYCKDLKLQENDVLKNVQRLSPTSLEDFLDIIGYLKEAAKLKYNNKLVIN